MADFIFNAVKGKWAYYTGLPSTNDALIVVPIESSGLEADSSLADYTNLSALLAGTSNEQTTMGRLTAASVANTVDNTGNKVWADMDDLTWTAPTGNAIGALVVCYDPDTTTGTDADLIPLAKYTFAMTPNGNDVTAVIDVNGFLVAQ